MALVLSAVPAQAATQWELLGGGDIFLVSASIPDGTCVPQGGRYSDEEGSRVSTTLFPRGSACTGGAGTQCRTTVPIGPDVGHLRFNATTCAWVVQ